MISQGALLALIAGLLAGAPPLDAPRPGSGPGQPSDVEDGKALPGAPRLKGIAGNGAGNDAPALQALADAASGHPGGVLQLPPGAYRITSPIHVRSNVVLAGTGRHWGTQIIPVGCPAFIIDGAGAAGGWVFRVRLQDMTIDARGAEGPAVVDVHAAYNVELQGIFVYSAHGSSVPALRVRASNDIVVRDFVAYGANNTVPHGLLLDGTEGPVSAKLFAPDVEAYRCAIQAQGEVNADIFSPYVERATIAYCHSISGGRVGVYGGLLSTVNGYPLSIRGDNLSVYGTDLDPYLASKRGGWGFYTPTAKPYRNVHLYDIPRMAQPGFVPDDANWLQLHSTSSIVPEQIRTRIDLRPHTIIGNTETRLFRLNHLEWAKVKLTLHGYAGDARVVEEFTFTVRRTTQSGVVATPVLSEGTKQSIELTVSLGADQNGVIVSVAPLLTGGQPLSLYGDLEVVAIAPALAAITLQ